MNLYDHVFCMQRLHLSSKYVHFASASDSSIYLLNEHLLRGYFVLAIFKEELVAPDLNTSQPGSKYYRYQ